MENIFAAFADKANLIWGAVLTGLSYAFGAHWPLFAFFFVLNVVDYVYGVLKARATDTMSSAKGAKGILKKVSYWVLIALAFGVSCVFIDVGTALGLDLAFLQLIGWFVLAIYIINELTSIVENMWPWAWTCRISCSRGWPPPRRRWTRLGTKCAGRWRHRPDGE